MKIFEKPQKTTLFILYSTSTCIVMFTRSSLTFYGNSFFSDVCWWGFMVRCASKRPLNSERSTKLLLTFMYIQCCANSSFLYILLLSIQTVFNFYSAPEQQFYRLSKFSFGYWLFLHSFSVRSNFQRIFCLFVS